MFGKTPEGEVPPAPQSIANPTREFLRVATDERQPCHAQRGRKWGSYGNQPSRIGEALVGLFYARPASSIGVVPGFRTGPFHRLEHREAAFSLSAVVHDRSGISGSQRQDRIFPRLMNLSTREVL